MDDTLISDLKEQIAKGQALAIIGAGVSIGATRGNPIASWVGLLEHGVKRCEEVCWPKPPSGWGDRQCAAIQSGDLHDLLSVAEQVARRLGAPDGGEYSRWLRETVGELHRQHLHERTVLEALGSLGIPLATTNYDELIEVVTGLRSVTWREKAEVVRVIRGDEPGLLHLHGHWRQPDSVILGIRSYERIMGDDHAQSVLHALGMMRTFLFIGFGAGLGDPNFKNLFEWMRKRFGSQEYRHYRLVVVNELDAIAQQHSPEERVFPVPYGDSHDDLAPFLRSLAPSNALNP